MTGFSFDKVPLVTVKKKLRRRIKPRKPRRSNSVTKIQASVRERPSSKAEVVKLMALVIDPIDDFKQLTDDQFAKRRKMRLKRALECLEIYDHFLSPKPKVKRTVVILRRGRKPLFRTQ